MDNFNALSKSAILTKLALDGYFIDLLTLNSFIKEWQIEAIYENEFGVEFFDNTSYETILNNLKERYNKTKEGLEGNLKEKYQEPVQSIAPIVSNDTQGVQNTQNAEILPENHISDENVSSENVSINLDDLAKTAAPEAKAPENSQQEEIYSDSVSLDDLAKEANAGVNFNALPDVQVEQVSSQSVEAVESHEGDHALQSPSAQEEVIQKQAAKPLKSKETIMPRAMKRLTPAPVSPMSCLNLNRSYDDVEEDYIEEYSEEFGETSAEEYLKDDVSEIIENESFSPEEIEKADNLINNAIESKNSPENALAAAKEESPKEENSKEGAGAKDELDLMQLAQTFAQNLTGGPSNSKDVPPADLEQIFNESYVEPFEELQDFVRETADEENEDEFKPEEYKSLQEDIPSDVIIPEVQPNVSLMPKEMNTSNLTAQDIRDIIRDEISKQSANVVPKPQNGEDIREIIREIVKQATDIAPQNAFKLDISHGTLDMIAKSIAKKIAIKLNSYYKLNSTKQNAKLQQFRERTIELKEKNQTLQEENKRLKLQLMETKETLNAYKPSMFGLFKFTGKKRR